MGVSIVKRDLEEPIRQIVINAGVEGAVIVMEVKKNKKVAFGFNAATEEYMDMIDAGFPETGARPLVFFLPFLEEGLCDRARLPAVNLPTNRFLLSLKIRVDCCSW